MNLGVVIVLSRMLAMIIWRRFCTSRVREGMLGSKLFVVCVGNMKIKLNFGMNFSR